MNKTDDHKKNRIKDENFNFLNETIIGRKNNVFRTILLLILCGMIFGIVASISFFWAKPYIENYFDDHAKDKSSETIDIVNSGSDTVQSKDEDSDCLEEMKQNVVTVVTNDDNDWFEASASNNYITSGLIVSTDNQFIILTDYNTIKKTDCVKVYLKDGNKYKASILSMNKDLGLALITLNKSSVPKEIAESMKAAEFNSKNALKVGEEVQFIGNPFGKESILGKGSLTSIENKVNIVDAEFNMLTTDISIMNTNMNGFIFDKNGIAIGMVNQNLDQNKLGKNYISSVDIRDFITYISKLASDGKLSYLGINGKAVTKDVIETVDDKMPYGIYVTNSIEDSPAYLTGIMNGDIVVSVNGKKTVTMAAYMSTLQKCKGDETIQIEVMRKGKEEYKKVTYNVKVGIK